MPLRERSGSRCTCVHKDGVLSKDAIIVCFASFSPICQTFVFPPPSFRLKDLCVCVPVISRNDVVLSHRLGFRLLLQLALDGADVVLQHLGKDDIASSI